MPKYFTLILTLVCLIAQANAQNITNWKTYTDKKNIKDFVLSGNKIWAATGSGAFEFNFSDSTYKTYSKSEGLKGTSLTTVALDKNGKVWFGSSTGLIDILDTANNSIKTIYDIQNSDKDYKSINELRVYSDTVVVSLDFGVSLIDSKNFIFLDTYFRFGDLPSNIKVFSALKAGVLFLATSSGVAVQKSPNINLSLPESWSIYSQQNGLPTDSVRQLAVYQGEVIAGTSDGIFVYRNNTFSLLSPIFNNVNVKSISAKGDSLFFVSSNKLNLFYNGTISTIEIVPGAVKLDYNKEIGLAAGSSAGVYASNKYYYPDGPYSNQFLSLSVDNSSNLWVATGKDLTGKGFSKFDGSKWTNYYSPLYPLPTNSYHVINAVKDNTVYAGNWGSGFARIKNGNLSLFTTENSPIQGIQGSANYLVISGFDTDSKGNLWILNYGAADKRPLSMLTQDSVWYSFQVPAEAGSYWYSHFNFAIDQNDTKWYGVQDNNKPGLYYYNEKGTYDNPADDKSGFLSSTSGLNSSFVSSLAADKMGDVWVGTSLGVNVITNTYSALTSSPQLRITSVFSLRQQTINCIAVDPINQKWVGTNQGLILVNSDGSNLITVFNSKNSPLMDDEIRSIAIDANKGIVYVGTDNGLVSFNTPYIKPEESFTSLFVYPNPFIINKNETITIEGLIKDSDIKILTVSGLLVNEFSSPGGRVAYWDGKDLNGKFVGSGVYLIAAYDKEGNNIVTGKIAIIKK